MSRPLPQFHPLGFDIERPAPPLAARRLRATSSAPLSATPIDALRRRARRALAILVARGERKRANELRRAIELLATLQSHHDCAAFVESIRAILHTFELVSAMFSGPLMRAAMDDEPVDVDALDAEVTQVCAARTRMREQASLPPMPPHGIAYRATLTLRDRAIADLARRLAT